MLLSILRFTRSQDWKLVCAQISAWLQCWKTVFATTTVRVAAAQTKSSPSQLRKEGPCRPLLHSGGMLSIHVVAMLANGMCPDQCWVAAAHAVVLGQPGTDGAPGAQAEPAYLLRPVWSSADVPTLAVMPHFLAAIYQATAAPAQPHQVGFDAARLGPYPLGASMQRYSAAGLMR